MTVKSGSINPNLWDSAKAVYRGKYVASKCPSQKNFTVHIGRVFSNIKVTKNNIHVLTY